MPPPTKRSRIQQKWHSKTETNPWQKQHQPLATESEKKLDVLQIKQSLPENHMDIRKPNLES